MFFILLVNKYPEVVKIEPWSFTICEDRIICLCSTKIGVQDNYCLEKSDFQSNPKEVLNKVGCFVINI